MNLAFDKKMRAVLAIIFGLSLTYPALSWSMMIKGQTKRSTAAYEKHETRKNAVATFLGWKGNKLRTTEGTFIIKDSVQVIDKAGTRSGKYKRYRGRNLPTVRVFYRNREVYKVVIE